MALFKRDFNKPGPGVPKNAPPKTGFARFFEVLGRDFGNLVKLNLLFCLCTGPSQLLYAAAVLMLMSGAGGGFLVCFLLAAAASVPAGAAYTATLRLVANMLRDEPGFLWHDFKKLFKENFRSSMAGGMVTMFLIASDVTAVIYILAASNQNSIVGTVVVMLSVLLFAMSVPYFFLQKAFLELKGPSLVKNSILLALANLPRTVAGTVLGMGITVALYFFLPLSFPVIVVVGYTIPWLIQMMWIWPPMDKTFQINVTLKKRDEGRPEEAEDAATAGEKEENNTSIEH